MGEMGLGLTVVQTDAPRRPEALPAVRFRVVGRPRGRGPAWFWAAHRAVRRAALAAPAALYVASDLYTLPALAAAARRHRARLVYDSRELYAALDSAAGRPLVGRAWGAVEGHYIGWADAVLTVGDRIADRLAETYGVARPTVLYNAPDAVAEAPDRDALRRTLGLPDDGRVVVLYQGLFRAGRGLPALVDAAGRVEGARLVLIGEGALDGELRQRGADLGDRLAVHPFVPPDVLRTLTPGADVGACLVEPLTESLRLSLPNKLFEYLAAGLPVVASPLPEVRSVFARAPAGLLADPASPDAVADALRLLLDPAARARLAASSQAALAPYTWTEGRAAFRHLISDLLPA
jgi:glycosyltransferase involved in cell wall biosynthesis